MRDLTPKDHQEAIALFRAQIVGALTCKELDRGALADALRELAVERYRPPGSGHTHQYAASTLERWYYAYKKAGLVGLKPRLRKDRGKVKRLNDQTTTLILDIRRENPSASVSLIVRTLVADGRLTEGQVSASAVRRLLLRHGLDRVPLRDGKSAKTRLRWSAERPGALWHGDVCHASPILVGGKKMPVRIHALLDDCSRYVVALEAHHQEREEDMLKLFVGAIRRHGPPDALYLDNGSTYRGDVLKVACGRMDISLLHARAYDPEARGKMERFWRTLREGCLDFTGQLSSLHDVNARLLAFLDQHYHQAPHSSLVGRSPRSAYEAQPRPVDSIDEKKLKDALTVRARRRVRRDTTVNIDGRDYELDQGWLAGRLVMVARSLVDQDSAPWVEHDGKVYVPHLVDEKLNAHLKRPRRRPLTPGKLPGKTARFDPAGALLKRASGRNNDDDKGGA